MQKTYYILLSIMLLFLYTGCSEDTYSDPGQEKSIAIKLFPEKGFITKAIDEDNLLSEQTVKNISIFFTEPSSNTITNKYVYSGFTSIDDYKLITLPLDPVTLLSKDIYIVANYDNEGALSAASTIDDLKALTTPVTDKNNGLDPTTGLCMYGSTLNFNFNDGSNSPAIVNMMRICAKIRINVTFPENSTLSTNNSYLISNAAKYTYVVKNEGSNIPLTDYFTYKEPLALTDNGSHAYTGITYIYEATQVPALHIYTHFNNSTDTQQFSTDLPLPRRNYLYDLSIEIYEGQVTSGTKSIESNNTSYSYKSVVKIYDEKGNRVE